MHLGTNFCSRQLPRQKLVAENLGEKAEVDKVFWIWNQYDKEKINMTSIEQPEDQYDKNMTSKRSIWQAYDNQKINIITRRQKFLSIPVLPWPLLLLGSFDSAGISSLPAQPLSLSSFPVQMSRNFLLMPRRYLFTRVRGGCEKVGEGVEDLWRPLLQTWDKNQVPWWIFISWFLIVLKASGVRKADFSDLFFLLLVQIEISCILPSVPHQSQLNCRKPGARSTTPGSLSALRATPLRWQPELVFDLNIVEDDYLNVIFESRGTVVLCFISNKGFNDE